VNSGRNDVKLICLIPSYNEEKSIGKIVRSVRDLGFDVLVVDDGSGDRTAALARENGAEVVVHKKNCGKGASLRRAFLLIAQRPYDAIIVMDADGQHLPGDIMRLVDCFTRTGAGIVVGNRMERAKGMPFVRWLTNASMSLLLSWVCRQRIPDSQCGFRIIGMPLLKSFSLETENFEIESEMLLQASRHGFKIASAPVATIYEGQASAIHPWKDTVRFFKFLCKKR
jgi:glycosyltransferase involved in cell wall biosynthesis